jgi:hypothetical protein
MLAASFFIALLFFDNSFLENRRLVPENPSQVSNSTEEGESGVQGGDDEAFRPVVAHGYSSVSTGGGEFAGPFPAGLDLLFGILIDIFAEVYEHQDGDCGPEGTLHVFKCFACFHGCCVLRVNVLITI